MINKQKRLLRSKILEKYNHIKEFCKDVGINESAFSLRMNGHRLFTVDEMKKIMHLLKLNNKDFLFIFFSE